MNPAAFLKEYKRDEPGAWRKNAPCLSLFLVEYQKERPGGYPNIPIAPSQ